MATRLRIDHDLDPNGHRILGCRGVDAEFSSGGDLSLGQGNFFRVAGAGGATTLRRIATGNWLPGSAIDLQFEDDTSIADGTAPGSGYAGISTPGGATVVINADRVGRFVYSSDAWVLHIAGSSTVLAGDTPLADNDTGDAGATTGVEATAKGHRHPISGKLRADSADDSNGFLQDKVKDGTHVTWTLDTTGGVHKMRPDVTWPTVPTAATTTPLHDGTGSAGATTSGEYAAKDHVHERNIDLTLLPLPNGTPSVGASGSYSDGAHVHGVANPVEEGTYLYPALIRGNVWTACDTWFGGYIWPFPGGWNAEWTETAPGSGIWNKNQVGSIADFPIHFDSVTPTVGMRVLAWYYNDPGEKRKYVGIYVINNLGSASTYAQIQRASDADAPGDFVAGKLVSVTGGNSRPGHLYRFNGPSSPTLGTSELDFEDLGAMSPPVGDRHELLTLGQLATEGATTDTVTDTGTASDGSDDYMLIFETLAGTPGTTLIPAGPWTFSLANYHLEADLDGGHVIRALVYKRNLAGNLVLLFTAESAPLHATSDAPYTWGGVGDAYTKDANETIAVWYQFASTSTPPVTITYTYNNATRGTWVKMPFAVGVPGTLDHQLLSNRFPDVAASPTPDAPAHPWSAIGGGRQHPGMSAATLTAGIITMPDSNGATLAATGTITGITTAGWLHGDPIRLIVTGASSGSPVIFQTGASPGTGKAPFLLPSLSGLGVTRMNIKLNASPAYLSFIFDAASNRFLLTGGPYL